MELSEEEIKEIENTAAVVPAVRRVWDEYNAYKRDAGKAFYKSLYDTTEALTKELESVSTGTYSKRRILTSDSKEWKRVFSLLVNAKKIIAGLDSGRELINGASNVIKVKENKKEEEDEISLTDKLANNKTK